MKKSRIMITGIVSGLFCAFSVFAYIQSIESETMAARAEALSRYGGEQIEVCVARRDIAPGEQIDSSNTTTKLWVVDLLPEDAIRSLPDVLGQNATSAILSGEVLSYKRFQQNAIEVEIPDGFSALSVPAKDVQAVGGVIGAGMWVDVYVTGDTKTELLASNVLVLSTSMDGSRAGTTSSVAWVTLAVKPSAVQEMIAASKKAELYFALPSSEEKGSS